MGVSENSVPLKGCYKGTIRVPLKGSIRVWGFRKFGIPYVRVQSLRRKGFGGLAYGLAFAWSGFPGNKSRDGMTVVWTFSCHATAFCLESCRAVGLGLGFRVSAESFRVLCCHSIV